MKFVWPTLLKSKFNEVGVVFGLPKSQNKFNEGPVFAMVTVIGVLILSHPAIVWLT